MSDAYTPIEVVDIAVAGQQVREFRAMGYRRAHDDWRLGGVARKWFWRPATQWYELWPVDAVGRRVGECQARLYDAAITMSGLSWVEDTCARLHWPALDIEAARKRLIEEA